MASIPQRTTFQDPVSIDEAEERLADLTDTCMLIQAQLSNKDMTDENGVRLSYSEWQSWRYRAIWALTKKRQEMAHVKRWINVRVQEAVRIEAGVQNPKNVIELFGALLRVAKRNVDFADPDPQEIAVIRLAERWIRTQGAPLVITAQEKARSAS